MTPDDHIRERIVSCDVQKLMYCVKENVNAVRTGYATASFSSLSNLEKTQYSGGYD